MKTNEEIIAQLEQDILQEENKLNSGISIMTFTKNDLNDALNNLREDVNLLIQEIFSGLNKLYVEQKTSAKKLHSKPIEKIYSNGFNKKEFEDFRSKVLKNIDLDEK